VLDELVVCTAVALLACEGSLWHEAGVRGELRRECGRELLRLEGGAGCGRTAATAQQPTDGHGRQQEYEHADDRHPAAHASLSHLNPPSRSGSCRLAPGCGLRVEALLEPRHDLRVDAPARTLRGFDEASTKLLGHAEQETISLP
jgi:hypothetical protein